MVKRTMDFVGGLVLLVVAAAPIALIALLILLRMGRPVLFTQDRPGLNGELFKLYKFRTMRQPRTAEEATPAADAARLTRLGAFLRRFSLDELPTLINVIKGDMSLVGPRPLLPQYLGRYSPEQARRHEVRPGITGLAQVEGRNALTWEKKLELDVWYVDNWSLWVDLRILVQTVAAVVKGRGVSQPGHATAEEFGIPPTPDS